jgi:hypothetical protein
MVLNQKVVIKLILLINESFKLKKNFFLFKFFSEKFAYPMCELEK